MGFYLNRHHIWLIMDGEGKCVGGVGVGVMVGGEVALCFCEK